MCNLLFLLIIIIINYQDSWLVINKNNKWKDHNGNKEVLTAFLCYPWHNNICDIVICYTCIYFAE